ncbi:MAG: PorT family protein [Chitinophagaceae bacterium]|nr:PorT family protein [Chitinophagaceae bacterium]
MKKQLLTIAMLGLTILNTQAQSDYATSSSETLKKIRFGVYVAPNLSFMRPSAAKDGAKTQENGGNKIGFTYGIMADFNFTENYAIATGLQVNTTGGKINTLNPIALDNEAISTKFDYTLQYLEVPVALKLKTDQMGKFTIFGQAGLTIGFNISKKATYEILQKRATTDTTYQITEKEKITGGIGNIAPVVFQMNVGAGVQYMIGSKLDGYVGLFFNNGFAPNVTDPTKYTNTPATFTDGNTRLNNFAVRLGFYF